MILNKEKLIAPTSEGFMRYTYVTTKEGYPKVHFTYVEESSEIIVSITDKKGEPIGKETKVFATTSNGFEDATKYFEQLIIENDPDKKNQPNQAQKPNPIGILCKTDDPKFWKIAMQDGRTANIAIPSQAEILKNVLKFLAGGDGFETDESFYIDIIQNNEDCYALYPTGDLEQQGEENVDQPMDNPDEELPEPGEQPENQSCSEGDPSDCSGDDKSEGDNEEGKKSEGDGEEGDGEEGDGEEGDGEEGDGEKGDGEEGESSKDGEATDQKETSENQDEPDKKMAEKLANYFSFSTFKDLIYYYTSKDELFTEMESYSKAEITSMMRNLGLAENTSIDQLKQKVG